MVTIGDYAQEIGRTEGYLHSFWLPRPGFPEPVGELAGRGRNGGGRRRKVYLKTALAEFRGQPAGPGRTQGRQDRDQPRPG